jgi:hypothetical protein
MASVHHMNNLSRERLAQTPAYKEIPIIPVILLGVASPTHSPTHDSHSIARSPTCYRRDPPRHVQAVGLPRLLLALPPPPTSLPPSGQGLARGLVPGAASGRVDTRGHSHLRVRRLLATGTTGAVRFRGRGLTRQSRTCFFAHPSLTGWSVARSRTPTLHRILSS